MLTPDEIAPALSRLCPNDGDDGTGKLRAGWDAANHFAASELVRILPELRAKAEAALSPAGRRNELSWLMVKEGRKLRNEYLAKAG